MLVSLIDFAHGTNRFGVMKKMRTERKRKRKIGTR